MSSDNSVQSIYIDIPENNINYYPPQRFSYVCPWGQLNDICVKVGRDFYSFPSSCAEIFNTQGIIGVAEEMIRRKNNPDPSK